MKKALKKEASEPANDEVVAPKDQLDDVGQNPGIANPVRLEDNVSTQSAEDIAPIDGLSLETEEQEQEQLPQAANENTDPYNKAA